MSTEMKYRFTGETNEIQLGESTKKFTVYRIQALRELTHFKRKNPVSIHAGDLGGWIESERNLSQEGESWIAEEAVCFMNGRVEGDAFVAGTATVFGNACVKDTALVKGDAEIFDQAVICENARIWGNGAVGGRVIVSGEGCLHNHGRAVDQAKITGKAQVVQNGSVTGSAVISDRATVGGSAHVGGIAKIGGQAVINGNADLRAGFYSEEDPLWLTVGPVRRAHQDLSTWITLQYPDNKINCESFSGTIEEFSEWAKYNLRIDPFSLLAFFKSHLSYLSFNPKKIKL